MDEATDAQLCPGFICDVPLVRDQYYPSVLTCIAALCLLSFFYMIITRFAEFQRLGKWKAITVSLAVLDFVCDIFYFGTRPFLSSLLEILFIAFLLLPTLVNCAWYRVQNTVHSFLLE